MIVTIALANVSSLNWHTIIPPIVQNKAVKVPM
jgi:hypothetical protein